VQKSTKTWIYSLFSVASNKSPIPTSRTVMIFPARSNGNDDAALSSVLANRVMLVAATPISEARAFIVIACCPRSALLRFARAIALGSVRRTCFARGSTIPDAPGARQDTLKAADSPLNARRWNHEIATITIQTTKKPAAPKRANREGKPDKEIKSPLTRPFYYRFAQECASCDRSTPAGRFLGNLEVFTLFSDRIAL